MPRKKKVVGTTRNPDLGDGTDLTINTDPPPQADDGITRPLEEQDAWVPPAPNRSKKKQKTLKDAHPHGSMTLNPELVADGTDEDDGVVDTGSPKKRGGRATAQEKKARGGTPKDAHNQRKREIGFTYGKKRRWYF